MKNNVEDLREFIIADDPAYLPLILLPWVRAVVWQRPRNPAVDRAVNRFTARGFDTIFNTAGQSPEALDERGFDPGQVMIERHAQRRFPELSPLWEDRLLVKKTVEQSLRTKFFLNQLQVQPAQRHTPDHILHQDRGTIPTNAKRKEALGYFKIGVLVAHNQRGTTLVPFEDAGRQTPSQHSGRRFYHRPHTLSHRFEVGAHDVCLIKSGPDEGAVHKAPYVRGGLRLLSFMISQEPYPVMRTKVSPFK